MKFGIVGLGRMGGNLALQALEKDHQVVGYSKSGEKKEFADAGVKFAGSLSGLVGPCRRRASSLSMFPPENRPSRP